jgi:hypothetical protein
MLEDVHGGAKEQAVELYGWIAEAEGEGRLDAATAAALDRWTAERGRYVP